MFMSALPRFIFPRIQTKTVIQSELHLSARVRFPDSTSTFTQPSLLSIRSNVRLFASTASTWAFKQQQDTFTWDEKPGDNWNELQDQKRITTYRALREDEWDCGLYGLSVVHPDSNISASRHVTSGSWTKEKPFISVTKEYDVALFYGSKAYHDRGQRDIRIAVVELDASEHIFDLTDRSVRDDLGFGDRSKESNYAIRFQEMLVKRDIGNHEILGVHCVKTILPRCRRFRNCSFPNEVEVVRAFPSESEVCTNLPIYEEVADNLLKLPAHNLELFRRLSAFLVHTGVDDSAHKSNDKYVEVFPPEGAYPPYEPCVVERIKCLERKLQEYKSSMFDLDEQLQRKEEELITMMEHFFG